MQLDFTYNRLNKAGIARKNREIIKVIKKLEIDIAKIINQAKIKYPSDFPVRNIYARNTSLKNKIDRVLKEFSENTLASIDDGVRAQWTLGNEKNDDIIKQISAYTPLADPKIIESMQGLNLVALDQFIARKQAGLNLSQRVWNIANLQNQELLELYLASGITQGRSAQKVSQDIRQLLNEPEKLFRRVKDPEGNLVLSQAAQLYHPGRGVYRSSAKNALRLSANEINMAFHNADFLRRQRLPFVKGVLVRLSEAHPREDICNALAGAYPRGFIFEGWHALGICYTITLLYSRSEIIKFLQGGQLDKRQHVRSIPRKAKSFLERNKEKLQGLKHKPYFLRKNFTTDLKLKKKVLKRSD